MKFEEILKLLRKGKKIRIADWETDEYLYMDEDDILTNQDKINLLEINTSWLNCDWEEYKEVVKEDTWNITDCKVVPFENEFGLMKKILKRIEDYVNYEIIKKKGMKDVTFKFVPVAQDEEDEEIKILRMKK